MHKELSAFFETHAEKTSEHKRAAHDQMSPMIEMVAGVQTHVIDLQSKLHQAELARHDHSLDPKMAWMHKRLRVVGERAAACRVAIAELAKSLVDLESGFDKDTIDINTMLSIPPGSSKSNQTIPVERTAPPIDVRNT